MLPFDQRLEVEHHPGAALRVGRGPVGLRLLGRGDGEVEQGGIAQCHAGLNLAGGGVEAAKTPGRRRFFCVATMQICIGAPPC